VEFQNGFVVERRRIRSAANPQSFTMSCTTTGLDLREVKYTGPLRNCRLANPALPLHIVRYPARPRPVTAKLRHSSIFPLPEGVDLI
jgi:hypothetical protein